jgi:hypothetical protein
MTIELQLILKSGRDRFSYPQCPMVQRSEGEQLTQHGHSLAKTIARKRT